MNEIDLNWQGPFAFFRDQSLPYLFDQDAAGERGVYLWALPMGHGHKVCYVGVAHGRTRTLGVRLAEELMDGVPDSRYIQVVDLDSWRRGFRKVLHDYGTFNSRDHEESLIEMHRLCVGFLAPMDADRQTIEHCERCLIRRFDAAYDDGDEYAPFLSNKSKRRNTENSWVNSHGRGVMGLPDGCLLDKDGVIQPVQD